MMKQVLVLAAVVVLASAHHAHNIPQKGIARLTSPSGAEVQGNVTFTQVGEKVVIEGSLYGLPPGQYGFHVHEKGDLTGGCLSTGSHFNPDHKDHGHPTDENRHVGDLGNIEFDENRVSHINITDSIVALIGPHGILGRAVVLHEKADDFGRSDHPDSRKTGNAGGRVACGVIGVLDPVYGLPNSASMSSPIAALLSFTVVLFINY